jgi:hypothetical protein
MSEKDLSDCHILTTQNVERCFIGGGNGVASVLSSPYLFSISKEGILAAILIDFLLEIELILHREVIHLKASLAMVDKVSFRWRDWDYKNVISITSPG